MNLPIVDLPRGGAPVPVPAPQAIVDLALPSYATTVNPLDVEPIQRFISSRLPRSSSTLSGFTLVSLKQTHNTTRLVLLDEHAVVVNVGQPLAFESCEIQRSNENPYPVVNTSNLQIGVAVEPPQPPPILCTLSAHIAVKKGLNLDGTHFIPGLSLGEEGGSKLPTAYCLRHPSTRKTTDAEGTPQPPPSVAGAGELDDDDIDVANPQGGSGDDGMMPGLVDSFP